MDFMMMRNWISHTHGHRDILSYLDPLSWWKRICVIASPQAPMIHQSAFGSHNDIVSASGLLLALQFTCPSISILQFWFTSFLKFSSLLLLIHITVLFVSNIQAEYFEEHRNRSLFSFTRSRDALRSDPYPLHWLRRPYVMRSYFRWYKTRLDDTRRGHYLIFIFLLLDLSILLILFHTICSVFLRWYLTRFFDFPIICQKIEKEYI